MTPKRKSEDAQLDEMVEETFPASDPPSFMAGDVVGAPAGRTSQKPIKSRRSGAKKEKSRTRHNAT
jgi:hypothetical protein